MAAPVSIGIIVLCFAFGVYLLADSSKARRYGRLATTWPTTNALVVTSEVEEDTSRNATGKVSVGYQVKVEYEYKVNNQQYTGDRVTVGRPVFAYLDASNYKEQFKPGNQVTVYYNPQDPAEALLAPRSTVGLLSPIPGIFLIVTALIIAVIAILFP